MSTLRSRPAARAPRRPLSALDTPPPRRLQSRRTKRADDRPAQRPPIRAASRRDEPDATPASILDPTALTFGPAGEAVGRPGRCWLYGARRLAPRAFGHFARNLDGDRLLGRAEY